MKDQVDTLVANGVPAACYNSAMTSQRQGVGARRPRARAAIRLLYVAPERLVGEAATRSSGA